MIANNVMHAALFNNPMPSKPAVEDKIIMIKVLKTVINVKEYLLNKSKANFNGINIINEIAYMIGSESSQSRKKIFISIERESKVIQLINC